MDGVNTVFLAPDVFLVDGLADPALYWNGQRLRAGATNDYLLSESGGAGSGYDTFTMMVAPKTSDAIMADYYLP